MSELDPSPVLVEALFQELPPLDVPPDWSDVLRRAGVRVERRRRLGFAAAVALAAATTLWFATPLGNAVRGTVANFSTWLRGSPGEPVAPDEQRAFEGANTGVYPAFPGSPQLRRLDRMEVDGVTYDLLGFRSAGSLCVRVTASGEVAGSTTECAPVDDLERDEAPVRVLFADWGVGHGDKTQTVGFDTYRAPLARVTAGIAAEGVNAVELTDDEGTRRVAVKSNAFLYVSPHPGADQVVTRVRALLDDGGTVTVPFTEVLRGPAPSVGNPQGQPGGPTHVDRVVHGGTIGWLERREPRGEPLDTAPDGLFVRDAVFGRVITPDPGSPQRILVAISRPGVPPPAHNGLGVCYALISRGGAGGGCTGGAGHLFERVPFTGGYGVNGVGAQYATFAGLASDDVARIEIFTSTGAVIDVPLRDNAYLASVALSSLPARTVAYDADGRVIGILQPPREDGPATPVGAPVADLAAAAAGSTIQLKALRTKEGGQCWFVKARGKASSNMGSCTGRDWDVAPLRVSPLLNPPVFVVGRAREDIHRIVLRYRDGDEQTIAPERYGYVLFTIPAEHREEGHELRSLEGLDARGTSVAELPLGRRVRHR